MQDWLSEDVESEGVKQAAWRTDPARSGAGGAIGDIGSHAFNLVSFTTQKQVERLSAQLHSFRRWAAVGRQCARDVWTTVAAPKACLLATQVAPGYENEFRLRVSGTKGSIEWNQSSANILRFAALGAMRRKSSRAAARARVKWQRRRPEFPVGTLKAILKPFATLYSEAATLIRGGSAPLLPTVQDGVDGVRFIEACVTSSAKNGEWVSWGFQRVRNDKFTR